MFRMAQRFFCDSCGRVGWERPDCQILENETLNLKTLRRAMAKDGWLTVGDDEGTRDLCPDCAKAKSGD
jgi:hypothetical protein